jgi:hypothetical protein
MAAQAEVRPAIQTLPGLSLMLLAAAAAHVVIGFATDLKVNGDLDLSPARFVFQLRDAMPFVLAASLVSGAARWPAARRWLAAACVVFVAAGTLNAAGQVLLALTWPPHLDTGALAADIPPLGVLGAIAAPFGPLLAAIGLARGSSAMNRTGVRFLTVVGAAAVAAFVLVIRSLIAFNALGFLPDTVTNEPFPGAATITGVVDTVGGAMVAALAVAAAWAIPRRYVIPEVLIAVGGLVAAIASTTAVAGLLVASRAPAGYGWIGTTGYLELLGLVTVAIGFFTARISVPGEG